VYIIAEAIYLLVNSNRIIFGICEKQEKNFLFLWIKGSKSPMLLLLLLFNYLCGHDFVV
jgi:hypothetical protein